MECRPTPCPLRLQRQYRKAVGRGDGSLPARARRSHGSCRERGFERGRTPCPLGCQGRDDPALGIGDWALSARARRAHGLRSERGVERRSTPRLLWQRLGRYPGLGPAGLGHRGASSSPRTGASPIHERQSSPRRRYQRGQDGAFHAACPERLETKRFDRGSLGHALEAAGVFGRRRRAGNLALGFRRTGGPAAHPSTLHGRHRAGGAGVRRTKGRPVRDTGAMGSGSHARIAQAVRQTARSGARGCRRAAREPEPD